MTRCLRSLVILARSFTNPDFSMFWLHGLHIVLGSAADEIETEWSQMISHCIAILRLLRHRWILQVKICCSSTALQRRGNDLACPQYRIANSQSGVSQSRDDNFPYPRYCTHPDRCLKFGSCLVCEVPVSRKDSHIGKDEKIQAIKLLPFSAW